MARPRAAERSTIIVVAGLAARPLLDRPGLGLQPVPSGLDLRPVRYDSRRCVMQAGAVPRSSFLVLPRRQDSAPALEFPAKGREGRDLVCRLSDPLAEHPEKTQPEACGAGHPGRRDEGSDGAKAQPESLRLANELQPVEI